MRSFRAVGMALVLASAGSVAHATTIIPVSVTASSSYPGYPAGDAIDQGSGSATSDWASHEQGSATTLIVDLGANYILSSGTFVDRVTSGGGNDALALGLTDFTTSFTFAACTSADCATTGPALSFTKSVPVNPASPGDFAYTADLTGLAGRYFLYSVTGVNGTSNPGLSNLSFDGAVPEPATWGLMMVGFGALGAGMRSRRRVSAIG